MKEWWEYRGICTTCKKPVGYGDLIPEHAGHTINTSWQSRVNPTNDCWRPGYRFKAEKNSGYRTYACFYGVDINGRIEFQGGVRAANEKAVVADWQEQADALPVGNWYLGCELENEG